MCIRDSDVFPGGTADFVKLNFKVSEDTILEEGDITVTVTDAANFNLETITEKFGTSVTYLRLDTSALETAIEKAKILDEGVYTTDSFQAVQQLSLIHISTSDIDGTGDTDETMNSASMEAYVLYSATLDGFETDDDIMWDYIPGDDPIGGLYFRFDVKDTTQAFAAGENGLGLLNLNATDCVQIALNGDPDNAGSGLTGKEWLYTFSGYTAGAPGVGEIPSGYGAWYEHWATGGGNAQTHGGYNIQIKTSMDVDFDPAYPLPEGCLLYTSRYCIREQYSL